MSNLRFITISSDPKVATQDLETRRLVRVTATRAARSHRYHNHDLSEQRRSQSEAVRETSQRGSMGRFRTDSSNRKKKKRPVKQRQPIQPQALSPLKLHVPAWHPVVDPLGDQAWTLLHYYRYVFRARSWAINAKKDWFAFVIEDQASTHATLAFVSLNRDLEEGSFASVSTLHHRSKALQLIREQLRTSRNRAIDDSLIGAVALLAITEGLEGHQSSSAAHVQALVKLVNLRGGFEKLRGNEALSRLVAWADLCHTSTFGSHRRLPSLFRLSDLDLNMKEVSAFGTTSSPFQQSIQQVMFPRMHDLVQLLAAVPRYPPNDDTRPDQRQRVSRLIYYINQLLLTIHHDGPRLGSQPADRLAKVLCYAAHLYISLILRQMPRRTRVVVERAQRLYEALEDVNYDDGWDRALQEPYVAISLWAQVLYFCSLTPYNRRLVHMPSLKDLLVTQRIKTTDQLEDRLGRISWINGHSKDELEWLLDECYHPNNVKNR